MEVQRDQAPTKSVGSRQRQQRGASTDGDAAHHENGGRSSGEEDDEQALLDDNGTDDADRALLRIGGSLISLTHLAFLTQTSFARRRS